MKHAYLGLLLLIGACSDDTSFAGNYRGTLTITMTGGMVVATTLAVVNSEEIGVTLSGSSGTTNVDALLQGLSTSGSAMAFDCSTSTCRLTLDATDFRVTAASGSMEDDLLSLAFSGESTTGLASSAVFMGVRE
jgi:hypothetical protein